MRPHQAYDVIYDEQKKPKRKGGDDLRDMESYFSYITGLPMPKRDTVPQRKKAAVRWWQPIREIYDLAEENLLVAKDLMAVAVSRMREDKLTVAAPQSIINIVLDEYATGKSKQGVQAW